LGSSGGKEKLGSINKRGDRYLRSLFTTGALAVIRYAKLHGGILPERSRKNFHGLVGKRVHPMGAPGQL